MRHWGLGLLCVGLLACKDGGDDTRGGGTDTEGEAETDRPSPYAESSGETGTESPTMQPDEVVQSAVAGLNAFIALQPDEVVAAYVALAQFDETCPEDLTTYEEDGTTTTLWYTEGCQTAAGLQVQGSGRHEIVAFDDGVESRTGASISAEGGTFSIAAPDGRSMTFSGFLYYENFSGPEGNQGFLELAANVSADPATAAASPLMDGSVDASGTLFSFAAGALKAVGGQGSISGPSLGAARAFQFSDLLVLAVECASEPAGTLSVRDDAGFWHDVVFDAAQYNLETGDDPVWDASKCDGCGAYLAAGEPLGDACMTDADINGLLGWENYPW